MYQSERQTEDTGLEPFHPRKINRLKLKKLFLIYSEQSLLTEECPICRRISVLAERIAQIPKERLKILFLGLWTLDTRQHLADIAPIVAVVEKRDVLVRSESGKEFSKSPWSFRELEHEETLVLDVAASADQEAQMAFGQFIIAQVFSGHTALR